MVASHPAEPDAATHPTRTASLERPIQMLLTFLPLLAIAVVLLVSLVVTGAGISDPDTFWHLRAGADLLADGTFVRPGTGSSFTTGSWTLHEWAPEVLLALGYRVAGLSGVGWVWEWGVVGIVMAVVVVCSRRARPLAASLATVLAFTGTLGGLSPRPQLVTFVLTTVTVGAWLATADDLRPRWWLIPLTWVWACSHGMWFFGPGIGGAVLLAILVDARRHGIPLPTRATLRLFAVPLLSGLVSLFTPVGPRLVLAPLDVAGYTQFISEWGPSRLSSVPYAVTLSAIAFVALTWSVRREPVASSRLVLWLIGLLLTVLYARTVAVAALVVAPLLAEALDGLLPRRRTISRRTLLLVTAASAAVTLGIATGTTPDRASHVPTSLSANLDALPPGTVVYNHYVYGGWLFWAHPDLRPVIDGRTELFSVDYVRATFDSYLARPGWQSTVARSRATYALLATDSPLGDALVHQLDWHVVATGDGARLLAAPASSP